ncbi:DUF4233 domain-containing protein [Microterricola viridarii]|uniref:DUF4233 domain-containing protein n=1 Tax=Microterricola viridarii TaxID=412690 RepID=A0A1H1UDS9_9MICO|nr:DUF4233 domain-containing protein [Microterricola viridarii]SDS70664.1 Protein of unknown function [Microterricola viridarii]
MTAAPAPRQSSVQRSLASIVLGFELVVIFLATLVIAFGPGAVLPPWVMLTVGGIVCLLAIATMGLLRHRWAYALGWGVQAVVVLSGFFNPAMFFIGALFVAMWAYCMITGARLDRQKTLS